MSEPTGSLLERSLELRSAHPDVLVDALGGSCLPLVLSKTGQEGEPADLVILVSAYGSGTTTVGGLPRWLELTIFDYRQPLPSQAEWPRVETRRYFPDQRARPSQEEIIALAEQAEEWTRSGTFFDVPGKPTQGDQDE